MTNCDQPLMGFTMGHVQDSFYVCVEHDVAAMFGAFLNNQRQPKEGLIFVDILGKCFWGKA